MVVVITNRVQILPSLFAGLCESGRSPSRVREAWVPHFSQESLNGSVWDG